MENLVADVRENRMSSSTQKSAVIQSVQIAERIVGAGQPCFVIAEAGVNHNGDVALAHKLIDTAADAKVDAVKFQTFDPEKLAAIEAPKATYQVKNTGEEGSQLEMLRKLVLPPSVYVELMQHARQRGLIFLSTPFDEDSSDFLEQMHLPAFKISSGDLTNHPFLAHLARKGRPLLLSTGMGSLEQVRAAVDVVRSAGDPPLVLFHCVTSYPANASDCNLRAMDTLQSRFGVPVGWSDHTTGFDVSVAAAALGAALWKSISRWIGRCPVQTMWLRWSHPSCRQWSRQYAASRARWATAKSSRGNANWLLLQSQEKVCTGKKICRKVRG